MAGMEIRQLFENLDQFLMARQAFAGVRRFDVQSDRRIWASIIQVIGQGIQRAPCPFIGLPNQPERFPHLLNRHVAFLLKFEDLAAGNLMCELSTPGLEILSIDLPIAPGRGTAV
jgi:hypothetical protein